MEIESKKTNNYLLDPSLEDYDMGKIRIKLMEAF